MRLLRGRHLSYQRSKNVTTPGTSLIKIEGVDDTKAAKYVPAQRAKGQGKRPLTGSSFYLGKKIAYVYRAHREVRGSKIRVIWGKVTRPHGTHDFWRQTLLTSEKILTRITHRQLRCRPREVHLSSPHKVFRCLCSCHAVPLVDLE